MEKLFDKYGVILNDNQKKKFEKYYELLTFYNEKFNITAITEKNEVIIKHFIDSALGKEKVGDGTLIDIGSGIHRRFPLWYIVAERLTLAAAQQGVAFVDQNPRQPRLQRIVIAKQHPFAQRFFNGALYGVFLVAHLRQDGAGYTVERVLHGHYAAGKFRLCHIGASCMGSVKRFTLNRWPERSKGCICQKDFSSGKEQRFAAWK